MVGTVLLILFTCKLNKPEIINIVCEEALLQNIIFRQNCRSKLYTLYYLQPNFVLGTQLFVMDKILICKHHEPQIVFNTN